MFDLMHSKNRQARLLLEVIARELDAIVLGDPRHICWASGFLPDWKHHAAFVLFANETTALIAAHKPGRATADEVIIYDATHEGTIRSDQPHAVAKMANQQLKERGAKRIGLDSSAVSAHIIRAFPDCSFIDDVTTRLRRRKDPDEVILLQRAIDCSASMHKHARQIIQPGLSEIEMYAQLHNVAVETAGEPLSALLGNDFTCGGGGGPPRAG